MHVFTTCFVMITLDTQERSEAFLLNDMVILPRDYQSETNMDELELPLLDFATLAMATNNFSEANKLGQGGFGSVYKVKYCFTHTFEYM